MSGIDISESQVRRLAHEVGAELIEQRDRKVIEHRRRQLPTRVAVIPDAVAVEVDGGRIRAWFTPPGVRVTTPCWWGALAYWAIDVPISCYCNGLQRITASVAALVRGGQVLPGFEPGRYPPS